ncbi:MAG: hypothetical protein HY909_09245 [Deltaproteobacteria bacterium]|nr:hypothetical protein [Deltaproteobacteria bacterium]
MKGRVYTVYTLCLSLWLWASLVHGQGLTAEPLVPSSDPARGLHLLRVSLGSRLDPWAGELQAESREYFPQGAVTRVLYEARTGRLAPRVVLLPALYGEDTNVVVRAGPFGTASVNTAPGPRHGGRVLRVALAGLGERVGQELSGALEQRPVAHGALAWDGAPSGPWPSAPSLWGGTDVVLASGEALLEAPPDARSALGDWLLAGGVLVLSPRNDADLRDPWLRERLGALAPATNGWASARCREAPFGCSARVGLGALAVLSVDLSPRYWTNQEASRARFHALASALEGGGVLGPGDLALFTEARDPAGSLRTALYPRVTVRRLLIPVSVLLGVYIIAVGVLFRRGRAAPLKVFARVPLLGLLGLVLVGASARVSRGDRDLARAVAFYDVASGEPRAFRRVLAGLTAGRARTFDVDPPAGGVALFRSGGDTASGALRWDGQRVSVARARLGLWETGVLYLEGMSDLGGAISVEVSNGVVRVVNGSRLDLTRVVYLDLEGKRVTRLPAAAPGHRVEAPAGRRIEGSLQPFALAELGLSGGDPREDLPGSLLLDGLDGGQNPAESGERGVLWALAALPQDLTALFRPFRPERPERPGALLRVVLTDPGRPFPGGRLRAHRERFAAMESPVAPALDAGDAGDTGADAREGAPP